MHYILGYICGLLMYNNNNDNNNNNNNFGIRSRMSFNVKLMATLYYLPIYLFYLVIIYLLPR